MSAATPLHPPEPARPAPAFTVDTLTNLVSGMGTGNDKRTASNFIDGGRTPVVELEAMYRSEWLAAAVVDYIPDDMLREWRTFDGLEPAQIDELQEAERIYRVEERIAQSLKWARLYGGCGLLMMIDGAGEMWEPLDPERVKPGALKWLQVIDRYWLIPEMTQAWDPTSEHFGEPQYYRAYTGPDRIHRSRLLLFDGVKLPYRMMIQEQWWGASVIDRVRQAVADALSAQGGIANLILEAKVDVIKIPDLFALLQGDETTQALMTRIQLAQVGKSIHNALIMDTNEEWEQKNIPLNTGMKEILEELFTIAAAAADIPVTRLMGEAAKGLNATGEGDMRNYYDSVANKRKTAPTPQLRQLDEVMLRSTFGTMPDGYKFEWPSLWQETEAEKAATGFQRAQTDQIYLDQGIIEPHHVAKRLEADGDYAITAEEIKELEALPHDDNSDPLNVRSLPPVPPLLPGALPPISEPVPGTPAGPDVE